MTAFYIAGAVLAAWALVVTALGIVLHGFPSSRLQEVAVSVVSVVLVAGAIGTGIVTAEKEEGGGEAAAAEALEGEVEAGEEEQGEGDFPAEPAEAEEALEIRAAPDGDLAFTRERLETDAGLVTIQMENPSELRHNVAIDGNGVDEKGEIVGEGGISTVTAELEPGTYSFYCSVAGHREAGMEGTLVVFIR